MGSTRRAGNRRDQWGWREVEITGWLVSWRENRGMRGKVATIMGRDLGAALGGRDLPPVQAGAPGATSA